MPLFSTLILENQLLLILQQYLHERVEGSFWQGPQQSSILEVSTTLYNHLPLSVGKT